MRFYFHSVPAGPPEAAGYEHGLIALAEGLAALGHTVRGNRDVWPTGTGYVIPKTDERPQAFDVVLLSHESWDPSQGLPSWFVTLRGPTKVYVDQSDGWRTGACVDPGFPADLVLRAHFQRRHRYHSRVKPWAFGLTNRMIEATKGGGPAEERAPVILCNFRVGHPLRDLFTRRFRGQFPDHWSWDERIDTAPPDDPAALSWWKQTGRRHSPAYYDRLKLAQGSLAFGGFFAPGFASAAATTWGRLAYAGIQRTRLATHTVGQFDSWRFWESLAAGCVTIHAPLEQWGAQLPVMPVPGCHYAPYEPSMSREAFLDMWNRTLVAQQGRTWALEHYGPEPTARRLLEVLQ